MAASQPRWSAKINRGLMALVCVSVACVGCNDSSLDQDPSAQADAAAESPSAGTRPDAAGEIEAGKRLVAEGQYEQAVEHFTRALEQTREDVQLATIDQREADVYYQRGLAYLKMGFPDTAVEDFSAAINLAPQHGAAYEQRGLAYMALGDMYNSLRDCTTAIRLQPDNIGAYHTRGLVYLRRGQFDRAVVDLNHAVDEDPALAAEIGPKLGEAYYEWSEELAKAGDNAAAAEKLAKARELNPAYVDSQTVVAAAEPAPIEQTVAKPIVEEADENFQRGRELQRAGRYDQALIEYAEAIALRRDFKEAYLRRGETLLALGFPDTALEDFKRATNRGGSAEAFRLQARAHMELENPHRAALSATEALHEDPTHAETYALRGQAYLQLENWERAMADLNEAMRRDPALEDRLQPALAEAQRGEAEARERAAELQASAEK